MVGKFIWNRTDNSIAVISAVGTNALTTTALLNGTLNTWGNGQTWVIDPFILSLEIHNTATTPYTVTAREEVLITGRSTDTLTAASASDRGYNGTTAQTFSASDYVYLHVTSPIVERFKDVVSVLAQQTDTNTTSITTANTNITNLQTGAYHYVVSSGSANAYVVATPALAAYAAGNIVRFKANFTNTGAATINVNSLGAKSIKKLDGATALAANDIISGQIVEVEYDGTNFQMLSPPGQVSASAMTNLGTVTAASAGVGSSSTAENAMSPTWTGTATISGNTLAAGSVVRMTFGGNARIDSGNLDIRVKVGGTTVGYYHFAITPTASQPWYCETVLTCRAAGASGTLFSTGYGAYSDGGTYVPWISSADTAGAPLGTYTLDTTGTLAVTITAQFSASDADHTCTVQTGKIKIEAAPS
jgi:hypothetical protein